MNLPKGIPLKGTKKKTQLLEHIEYILTQFDLIRKVNSQQFQSNTLFDYTPEVETIPNIREYDIRDHANMLNRNFYINCVFSPLKQIQKFDNEEQEKDFENNLLLKTVQSQGTIFGNREIIIQCILFLFFVGLLVLDCFKLHALQVIHILRIINTIVLFGCEILYVVKCRRYAMNLTIVLSMTMIIVSVMEGLLGDIIQQELVFQILDVLHIVVIIGSMSFVIVHLFRLEMELQKIRMLFGGKYQAILFCI